MRSFLAQAVCPSDVLQAKMMADWIYEDGHRRVAMIFINNSWGQGLKNEFTSNFTKKGGQVVASEAINEGDRDLRAQITKIADKKPDAL